MVALAQKAFPGGAAAKRTLPALAKAGPIVKWAGGKAKLVEELASLCPRPYRRYFEPFLGGGALFFHLAPPSAVLSDLNADLMNLYRCVADDVEGLIRRLAAYRRRHSHKQYYAARERWNDPMDKPSAVAKAAAFLYLNKTCYNGLWRVNSKGRFNVPVGRYESPQIYDAARLRGASTLLQRADLGTADFVEAVAAAGAGDFVYFDPPYHPLSETANFTSYTAASFGERGQHTLANLARRLAERGCHVMISNSSTAFVRSLYRGFFFHSVHAPRAINSKACGRGAIREVVITSYSPPARESAPPLARPYARRTS